jgi:radical SAM protein with 4Fe4S-binding SPASM domain
MVFTFSATVKEGVRMLGELMSKSRKAIKAFVTRQVNIDCDRIPYRFDAVPFKKIMNWILVEASIFFKPERPWGWPTHLMMEPTTHCNLNCALCPVTVGLDRPAGHMDFKTFQKTIDELGDYVFILLLWDWGEPFLNPSIYEMISYAKKKGIKVISSTNGHLFGTIDQADRLIASGLDTIIFAIDGISQEAYERYRQGGNLESVLQGIRTMVERKGALHSITPRINLRFIVMKHNEHEIPALKELARSVGADALTLKTLNPYSQDPYAEEGSWLEENQLPFLPEDPHYRRFKYDSTGQDRIRLRRNPCKNLWNHPVIHWSGSVCPCTYDPREKYVLGDVKNNSFKSIWLGAPYRRMRRQFRTSWDQLPLCRGCSYAYKGGNCYNETILDAFFFDTEDDRQVIS